MYLLGYCLCVCLAFHRSGRITFVVWPKTIAFDKCIEINYINLALSREQTEQGGHQIIMSFRGFFFAVISIFIFFLLSLQYELLFCIEDKCDPAISVVETLMQKYPMIDSKLFIGEYSSLSTILSTHSLIQ